MFLMIVFNFNIFRHQLYLITVLNLYSIMMMIGAKNLDQNVMTKNIHTHTHYNKANPFTFHQVYKYNSNYH